MNTANSSDIVTLRETIKAELKKSWEPELKAERLAAERKQGRKNADLADHSHESGRVTGLCEAASFFIRKGRPDIAQHLLSHFLIDRSMAASALEADKRTKSMTLAYLDKSEIWSTPLSALAI